MRKIFLPLAMLALLSACAFFTGNQKVSQESVVTWQDADSKRAADLLVGSMISQPWYREFIDSALRTPVLAIGAITYSGEGTFPKESMAKALENTLIGFNIRLVAGRNGSPAGIASTDPTNELSLVRSTGADFLLRTSVSASQDKAKGGAIVSFGISLSIIDAESGTLVGTESHTFISDPITQELNPDE